MQFPPMLGNGSIVFFPNEEGVQSSHLPPPDVKNICLPGAAIWRAGMRYAAPANRPLIPFGHLSHSFSTPLSVSGKLDTTRAVWESRAVYAACTLTGTTFVHHDRPLICLRRVFAAKEETTFAMTFRLAKPLPDTSAPDGMRIHAECAHNAGILRYEVSGQSEYSGSACFFADKAVQIVCGENSVTLALKLPKGQSACTFYLLFDDAGSENPEEILRLGFSRLLQMQAEAWADGCFVTLGDTALDAIWQTAKYHLRCIVTPWSIPTGITDAHWQGHYFAFDEYFLLLGLLACGQTEPAKRVPAFRKCGLPQAIARASCLKDPDDRCARFPWETVETGEEASPAGYWLDHIFHMAMIACGAWEVWLETRDDDYLRETAYPLITACARFYLRHSICETADHHLIIGRCTDLERLGTARQNAYMTSCGVIRTLEICGRASRLLRHDTALAAQCESTATRLRESLPNDGQSYLPYPGCEEMSIALLAGIYPFACIPKDDPKQLHAIQNFIAQEKAFGNMYRMGRGINPWYAAWKGVVCARLGDGNEAWRALGQVAQSCGVHHECWEILEDDCLMRPWFATAAATYLTAVHDMLVFEEDGTLCLLQGIPKQIQQLAFSLPCRGRRVSLTMQNRQLQSLQIMPPDGIRIRLPEDVTLTPALHDVYTQSGSNDLVRRETEGETE